MTTHIPSLTLPDQFFSKPAVAVLLPVVLGFGSNYLLTTTATDTDGDYKSWKKPRFHPPPWAFPVVWSILFPSMGLASYFAWTTGTASLNPQTVELAKHGATLYTIQLGLLQLFMPLYFTMKKPILGSVNIVTLGGIVGYLISVWRKVDERATWLLVPYLGWLSVATYLSVSIGHLNKWDLTRAGGTKPAGKDH